MNRIDLKWEWYVDDVLQDRMVWVPGLTTRVDGAYGRTMAVLCPYAAQTIMPIAIARELELDVFEFREGKDAGLPWYTLRHWGRKNVEVFGRDEEGIVLPLEIAFDVSERADRVILGQQFFSQVKCVLDGDQTGESYIEVRPADRE